MMSTMEGTLSSVHHDILQTHILTRLDGPTLAAVSCASSELHLLSTEDKLWQEICTSTWPSINDPLITSLISTFPSRHRSFFSDSYPLLYHHHNTSNNLDYPSLEKTTELISAVDIYYKNVPILSKVEKTETVSGWFMCSPFRVDLIDPKEFVPTRIPQVGEKDLWLKHLEENIRVSWILIDPKKKRAMNVSSRRAVGVQRHWLTGEVQVKFAIVMRGDDRSWEMECVQCEVVVTCGGKEGGGVVHVRDVSLGMEDMEGKAVTGKDSLAILEGAMERGKRRKGDGDYEVEVKQWFKGLLKMRMERKKRMQKRDRFLDWVCVASGISSFMAFWSYILFS